MFRLLVALVVVYGMAFSETVQDWIAKGTRAYAEMKLDESAANFKKAVELDPDSGQAPQRRPGSYHSRSRSIPTIGSR
jgi:hypothetical protein